MTDLPELVRLIIALAVLGALVMVGDRVLRWGTRNVQEVL